MKVNFEWDTQSIPVDLTPTGDSYRISIEAKTVVAQILQAQGGRLDLLIDGKRITAHISSEDNRHWVTIEGQTIVLTKSSGSRKNRGGHAHTAGELTAPMPGQIRAVNVSEGEAVTRGQTLLLLEAMKMEIRVQAPQDGVVKKLFIQQGQTVEREQMLVEIIDPS